MAIDADNTAPLPRLSASDIGVQTAPTRPTLTSSVESRLIVFAAAAPLPVLSSSVINGAAISSVNAAPLPTLSTSTIDSVLRPATPQLSASGVSGGVISARLAAPIGQLYSALITAQLVTSANSAVLPRLRAVLASGGIAGVTAAARLPSLRATVINGAGASARLTAPAPTLRASGYPAGVSVLQVIAQMPRLRASFAAAVEAVYRTWALNLRNNALTEYDNFEFNSYAVFNGKVLACGPGGVVELGTQQTDDGCAIDWAVRFGQMDFGTSFHKRVPRLYVDAEFSDDVEFMSTTVERGSHKYVLVTNKIDGRQQRRVPIGKGPRSRFFQYQLNSVRGCSMKLSSVMVYPAVLRRRVQ